MTYEATVEFKFNSTYTHEYKGGFGSTTIDDDFIPEEHFVITAPAGDLNCRQYFKLFEKFMLAVGMSPHNIREGAMSLVLNEWVNDADQRKICDEYEVTRNEDLHEKFKEWKELDVSFEHHKKNVVSVPRDWSRFQRFAVYTDDQLNEMLDTYDQLVTSRKIVDSMGTVKYTEEEVNQMNLENGL